MNTLIFSPTCQNPTEGLLEFAVDTKPFRTKILETNTYINFSENVTVRIKEEKLSLIELNFNYHTGICNPIPSVESCIIQGFEVELFDDDVTVLRDDGNSMLSAGFEPTLQWEVTATNTGFPIGTRDVFGKPLFYDFKSCIEVDDGDYEYDKCVFGNLPDMRTQPHKIQLREIYSAGNNAPIRIVVSSTTAMRENDEIRFRSLGISKIALNPVYHWFNATTRRIERWSNNKWVVIVDAVISDIEPTIPASYQKWFNPVTKLLGSYLEQTDSWTPMQVDTSMIRPAFQKSDDGELLDWLTKALIPTNNDDEADLIVRLVDPTAQDSKSWFRLTYEVLSYKQARANGFRGSNSKWRQRALMRPSTASNRLLIKQSQVRSPTRFELSVHTTVQEIIAGQPDEPIEIVIRDAPTGLSHTPEVFFVDYVPGTPSTILSALNLSILSLHQIRTDTIHDHNIPRTVDKAVFGLVDRFGAFVTGRSLNLIGPVTETFDVEGAVLSVCRSGFELYSYESTPYESGPLACGVPIADICADAYASVCTNVVEVATGWIPDTVPRSTVFSLHEITQSISRPDMVKMEFSAADSNRILTLTIVPTTLTPNMLGVAATVADTSILTLILPPIYGKVVNTKNPKIDTLGIGSTILVKDLRAGHIQYGHEYGIATVATAADLGVNVLGLLKITQDVLCATTTAIDLSAPPVPLRVDGITIRAGDRILVKNQPHSSENGIYVFNSILTYLERAHDFRQTFQIVNQKIHVRTGTVNKATTWSTIVDCTFVFDWSPSNTGGIGFHKLSDKEYYKADFVISGLVNNPYWNWSILSDALYVSANGQLTDVDPMYDGRPQLPVGKILTPTLIMFNPIQPECLGSFEFHDYEHAKFESGVDSLLLKTTRDICGDDVVGLTNTVTTVASRMSETLTIEDTTIPQQPITMLSICGNKNSTLRWKLVIVEPST